jgi:3-deoxy-D-manno-octulosonic-acid transferase
VLLLYNLFLSVYRAGIAIAALWNPKARAWQQGRNGQWARLQKAIPKGEKYENRYWMHCASLGEFEQGRPVLEALKKQHADCFIVLSFFSPSGYEIRKNYEGADVVCYLPMDGPAAARRFLNIMQPTLALFVKYEFWHYYLRELQQRSIPTVLVCGAFRKSQPFFKWWGGFFRKMLSQFQLLTVQDTISLQLLQEIKLGAKAHLTGDTRYDRVAQIATAARDLPLIEVFKRSGKLVIAGSTWPDDERMLKEALRVLPEDWKLVIAPHEIDKTHLESIKALFGQQCVFYSGFQTDMKARVLVIDNIGMLSSLYCYGEIACIGGGFNRSGIHNVLEPAVFGLPVIMGPEYEKFSEAVALVKKGFAFSVNDAAEYSRVLQDLITDNEGRHALQELIKTYVQEHTGATAKILALLPAAV